MCQQQHGVRQRREHAGFARAEFQGFAQFDFGRRRNLRTNDCYPQPCTVAPTPFNFPTNGFCLGVADAAKYATAIGNKIRIVTGQVPEPSSIALVGLALLGLALVGLGLARRRQRA